MPLLATVLYRVCCDGCDLLFNKDPHPDQDELIAEAEGAGWGVDRFANRFRCPDCREEAAEKYNPAIWFNGRPGVRV